MALSIVKIGGLAIGMATFLITALYYQNEKSFDQQHPGWEKIYRYVHRAKSQDELQSFAFTSATTGPALKVRYSEVEDFSRILRFEVSLKRTDADVGFVEKNFAFADANFLQFFSFPVRGTNDTKVLTEPYAVVLTPSSAHKYFGNADPVGKTLLLNGLIELTVKGVFKTDFARSHLRFDFVASFATLEAIKNHAIVSKQIPASLNLDNKGFGAFYTYLRLTTSDAGESLEKKFPSFIEEFRGKGRSERLKPTLQSLASIHLNSDLLYEVSENNSEGIVLTYLIAGMLILITAIINYVNLSTAEFFMRARNVGLKKILGIGRQSLLLGHLTETMVVCGTALVVGGIIAFMVVPKFNSIMGTQLTFLSKDIVWPFLIVYTTTVVLSGLIPAIQILRQNALVAFAGHGKTVQSSTYMRNSLVFIQLVTSFVLLAVTFLVARQTNYLLQSNAGFDAAQVMVVNAGGMPPNERMLFKQHLIRHQQVANVSMCSTPPGESLFTFGLTLPGANGDEDRRITFYHLFVDEDFLETMGIGLRNGRFFEREISADSLNSFVVNQTGAAMVGDSMMSRPIDIPNIYTGKRSSKTIVGVIDDFHFASFHKNVEPLILECNPKYARYLVVRFNSSNARAVVEILEQLWRDDAPNLPLDFYFLNEGFEKYYTTEQRTRQIVTAVSIVAVCLTALGIFGTSMFVLQQRMKEIAVRKLLGSPILGLFVFLFRPIFYIFFAACVTGVPIALTLGEQWLSRYPYRTEFSFGILFISSFTILTIMLMTISSYLVKIGRIQPAQVLRNQ